jgi:hypothetical protein
MSGEKVGKIWDDSCVMLCHSSDKELKQHVKCVGLLTLGKKEKTKIALMDSSIKG